MFSFHCFATPIKEYDTIIFVDKRKIMSNYN